MHALCLMAGSIHRNVVGIMHQALDMTGVEAALQSRTVAAATITRVFSPLLRAQEVIDCAPTIASFVCGAQFCGYGAELTLVLNGLCVCPSNQ